MTAIDEGCLLQSHTDDADALFRLQLGMLKGGAATTERDDGPGLMQPSEQAKDLVQCISEHLARRQLTPTMTQLLLVYLSGLNDTQRWALLGLNERRRRKAESGQKNSAVHSFGAALQRGDGEKAALIAAYDAYYAAMPSKLGSVSATYAIDLLNKNASGKYKNKAEERMSKAIRPCLVKAGFFKSKPSGRPKNE